MYSKQIMQLFSNPQNVGEIRSPEGYSEIEDEVCGNIIKIFLKIENDVVVDARFKAFGCAVTIAASELICEMVKGEKALKILTIVDEELFVSLGEMPIDKLRCAVTAKEAVFEAVANYQKKQARKK